MKPAHHIAPETDPAAPINDALSLAGLLGSALATRGSDILIRSVAGHGEPLSFAALDMKSNRLAAFMQSIQPKAGANVIIATLLGENTLIAMLGCLKAGLTPCLAPADLDADALTFQLEHLEAPIAIGMGEVGELRPLLALREAGMRSFHLQLAAGFGPSIPEGVANLELALAEHAELTEPEVQTSANQIRIIATTGRAHSNIAVPDAVFSEADLMASSLAIAQELRAVPGSRIITTMVGCDLAAIASSFGVGIMSGLEVTPLGLFSLARLWACLSNSITTHLVVPASIEATLIQTGLTSHKALTSLILVHETGEKPHARGKQIAECVTIDVWRQKTDQIIVSRR